MSLISFTGKVYLTQGLKSKCSDKASQNEIKCINHYAQEYDCDIVVFNKRDKQPFEASKYDTFCYNTENIPEKRMFTIGISGIEGISTVK